ncbi:MAG: hypothetical protein ACRDBO_14665 [Lachnospiraceae bacterium]
MAAVTEQVTEMEVYTWQDVSKITGYGRTMSCTIIRRLQENLVAAGYIKPKAGTISKAFFHEHWKE